MGVRLTSLAPERWARWGAMPTISLSYDQAAAKIATQGWLSASTSPITYGFRSSDSGNPGFRKFTSTQINAAEQALKLWSDVANIKFERSGGTGYTNSATMLFQGETGEGGYAWAYFTGSRAASSIDGDVYINPTNGWFTSFGFTHWSGADSAPANCATTSHDVS